MYHYYVRFSVYHNNGLIGHGFAEAILEEEINSMEQIYNVIDKIKQKKKYSRKDYIEIDWYSFLKKDEKG